MTTTKEKAEATQRPWFIDGPDIAGLNPPDGGNIICHGPAMFPNSFTRWPANRGLIVRAVNSFDELLAACLLSMTICEMVRDGQKIDAGRIADVLGAIRRAVDKGKNTAQPD